MSYTDGVSTRVHRESAVAEASALSVAEVCAIPLMSGVDIIAGRAGLERRVARLNVMTVPEVARWTKPSELLLTTGYPLPRPTSKAAELVAELDDCGVSALAVKFDGYVADLPAEVLRIADDRGFPILALPRSLALDDILSTVVSMIANRQAVALARANDLHDALVQVSLRGSLDDVVEELSDGLGGAGVLCADNKGDVLAEHLEPHMRAELQANGLIRDDGRLSHLAAAAHRDDIGSVMIRELPGGGLAQGHLMAIRQDHGFDSQDTMMVEQAAMIAALNVSRTAAVRDVTRRYATSALHGLLTGPENQVDDLVSGSAPFGWNLDRPLRVLVGLVTEPLDTAPRDRVQLEWESVIRAHDLGAAAGPMGASLLAICSADIDADNLAKRLIDRLARHCSVQTAVGVSEQVLDATALRSVWPHARTAAELAQRVDEEPRIRRYESMRLLRLIDAAADRVEIDRFLRSVLGPVLDLPERDREMMLGTLRELVRNRFNVAETARTMHYHYNTLRYRVRKLEQLLGDFTSDSQMALDLGVALEILPLASRTSTASAAGQDHASIRTGSEDHPRY